MTLIRDEERFGFFVDLEILLWNNLEVTAVFGTVN